MPNRSNVYTSPIIFSSQMIKALLEGRKTQTRRLITSQWANVKMRFEAGDEVFLWVREGLVLEGSFTWLYRADNSPLPPKDADAFLPNSRGSSLPVERGYVPSIHMARWASRISLKVTDVRKEHLQSISREDAIAEGLIKLPASGRYVVEQGQQYFGMADHNPVVVFRDLWDSLHGHKEGESWDDNPELYAFTFEVIQQNIDEVAA